MLIRWKSILIFGLSTDCQTLDRQTSQIGTGIWLIIAAIGMCFAALTSAFIIRAGAAQDWQRFNLPSTFYFNILILVGVSALLEVSRRRMNSFNVSAVHAVVARRSIWISMGLGLLFITNQCVMWFRLSAHGTSLNVNPSGSFFYLLTVTQALQVAGGLFALFYLARKLKCGLRVGMFGAVTLYWHFTGLMGLYLLCLVRLKIQA